MLNQKKALATIIIPVKNEGSHIQNTILSLFHSKTSYPFETIVVDDGSIDGCCESLAMVSEKRLLRLVRTKGLGSAAARNYGAQYANGDYLVFCDAHLFFEDGWLDGLLEPIERGEADAVNPGIADAMQPDRIGFGYRWSENLEPTWNIAAKGLIATPLLAGGCLAISRRAFLDIGGFDRGFRVWGREDEEISLKLWLFGYRCYVQPEVTVRHIFRPYSPPFALEWEDVDFNLMRMAYSHFNIERIEKCKRLIQHSIPSKIESLVNNSDVLKQRDIYFRRRKYTDSWFMAKFEIDF